MEYFKAHPVDPIDVGDFESSCGVGVSITPEQIGEKVAELVAANREELVVKRYHFNTGALMGMECNC